MSPNRDEVAPVPQSLDAVIHAQRRREILSPEGVPLNFQLAPAGARVLAFVIDMLVLALILVIFGLGAVVLSINALGSAVAFLIFFLLFNFYFAAFEIYWQGRTIGKRMMKIRVVRRKGGTADADRFLTRNLTRNLEAIIPAVSFYAAARGGEWTALIYLAWLIAFGGLAMFHRDRLRLGDLIAGTMVVKMPHAVLLTDLVAGKTTVKSEDANRAELELQFTVEQLGHYGEHELHVLEDVLRKSDRKTTQAVADRIIRKIGWSSSRRLKTREFLRAFYRAQRAHLEQRRLLGQRKASKVENEESPHIES